MFLSNIVVVYMIIIIVQWAEMILRADECTTFGIKKFSACSKLQPKLNINNKKLSPLFKKEPPLDISAVILTLK